MNGPLEFVETGRGNGSIFSDPDPDAAREFFKGKSRSQTPKLLPLKEAVERYVHDGDYLVLGGFGAVRAPIAAAHEIVRQGRKHLAFAGHTSTHDIQVLTAGDAYDRVDAAYVVGLEARGLSPACRKRFQSGEVEVVEETNHGLALRFKAAAMGVPFLPMRNALGTDTFTHGCGIAVTCPFTQKTMVLKPAIYADIAFVHVHEADVYGNARFRGIQVSDLDVANSAKRLVLTAERIVPHDEMVRDPSSVQIPFYLVDAVCEVPFGAFPGCMPYEYFSDEEHLRAWLSAEKNGESYGEFVQEHIFDCADHNEYVARCGGVKRMLELRAIELGTDMEARVGSL